MRQRLLSVRPSVTRASRHDPRGVALENVAAEFALLAQRRARLSRQLDRMGREFTAIQASVDAVQQRMAMLAQRMDGIDPGLRADHAPMAAPPPIPPMVATSSANAHRGAYQPPPAHVPARPDGRVQPPPRIKLAAVPRRRPFPGQ